MTAWDLTTSEYHAGQDWQTLNFIFDYSVTTNGLGMPLSGKKAAIQGIELSSHYPPANNEPAQSNLAAFLKLDSALLLLGNGASELISLLITPLPTKAYDGKDVQYRVLFSFSSLS